VVVGVFWTEVMRKSSLFSHGAHVLISVFASVMYLTGFGTFNLLDYFMVVFAIVFIAVLLPCCASDIIFPTLFVGGDGERDLPDSHPILQKRIKPTRQKRP